MPSNKSHLIRCRVVIDLKKPLRRNGLTWHAKGDYLASNSIENAAAAVLIHRLSRRQTQTPFAKSKGLVQALLFHPEKPFLFVATNQHVRVRFERYENFRRYKNILIF